MIAHAIDADPKIDCTQEQSTNLQKFGDSISNFLRCKSTKEKYLKHCWQKQQMKDTEMREVLGLLEDSPERIPVTDNYFVNSPLFVDMLSEIQVLAHDFHKGGKKDFILFRAKDAERKIELASQIYENETGKDKCAVQFSCDFTHIPGGKWQLGIVVVEDLNHKAWPVSYIVCPTQRI